MHYVDISWLSLISWWGSRSGIVLFLYHMDPHTKAWETKAMASLSFAKTSLAFSLLLPFPINHDWILSISGSLADTPTLSTQIVRAIRALWRLFMGAGGRMVRLATSCSAQEIFLLYAKEWTLVVLKLVLKIRWDSCMKNSSSSPVLYYFFIPHIFSQ